MYTKIAMPKPFNEGAPHINAAGVFGASPNRDLVYKIPTTGKRLMKFSANLPKGLTIDSEGVITGRAEEGEFRVSITAENEFGKDEKEILFKIKPGALCLTPLMGWTTWNAFKDQISHEVIVDTAKNLISTGLAEYGYSYVNIDSDSQGEYGGEYNSIMPNKEKFPDMKTMCDEIHKMGLKAGIYSTPMLHAYGMCKTLPGTTTGDYDTNYMAHYGIGVERHEEAFAKQLTEWGFDYLKYDWWHTDIENAKLMKAALNKQDRDVVYCATTRCTYEDRDVWKDICSMWRDNTDSRPFWENLMEVCFECDKWLGNGSLGHYFDLDMLETSVMHGTPVNPLTEDEQLIAYTARVIFPSPIQLSCDLSKLTNFDMAMYCNEEVIAVNQDIMGKDSVCTFEEKTVDENRQIKKHIKLYERELFDGSKAVAVFNLGTTVENVTIKGKTVRDLWAKEDLETVDNSLVLTLAPHTVRLIKKND